MATNKEEESRWEEAGTIWKTATHEGELSIRITRENRRQSVEVHPSAVSKASTIDNNARTSTNDFCHGRILYKDQACEDELDTGLEEMTGALEATKQPQTTLCFRNELVKQQRICKVSIDFHLLLEWWAACVMRQGTSEKSIQRASLS